MLAGQTAGCRFCIHHQDCTVITALPGHSAPAVQQRGLTRRQAHNSLIPQPHGEPAGHPHPIGLLNLSIDLLQAPPQGPLPVLLQTQGKGWLQGSALEAHAEGWQCALPPVEDGLQVLCPWVSLGGRPLPFVTNGSKPTPAQTVPRASPCMQPGCSRGLTSTHGGSAMQLSRRGRPGSPSGYSDQAMSHPSSKQQPSRNNLPCLRHRLHLRRRPGAKGARLHDGQHGYPSRKPKG